MGLINTQNNGDGTFDLFYENGDVYQKSINDIQEAISFNNELKADPLVSQKRKDDCDILLSQLSIELTACQNA